MGVGVGDQGWYSGFYHEQAGGLLKGDKFGGEDHVLIDVPVMCK